MASWGTFPVVPIIGFVFLLFRLWLVEVKLQSVLGDERRYISRFLSYYFAFAMIYNFQNITFNLILVATVPIGLISILEWDRNFFRKRLRVVPEYQPVLPWMIIERITLHVPMVITGIIFYFTGLKNFVFYGIDPTIFERIVGLIYGTLLVVLPLIILDIRWTKKEKWPTARNMLIGEIILMVIWYVVLLLIWK